MSISDFETQTLAMQNVQNFLLTALIRPVLREAGTAGAELIIRDLQREFSQLELPGDVRTDPETLSAISDRHTLAQQYLAQFLRYAAPPTDGG